MKRLSLIYVVLLLTTVIGCKKIEGKEELNNTQINKSNSSAKTISNDTLVISDNNIVVLFEPNRDEIEKLKQKHGENNFYIIADDVAGYIANITEQFDLKKIKYVSTDKSVVNFKKINRFVCKNQLKNKWSLVYIDKNKKINIVAPIDFDISNIRLNSNLDLNKWYGKYDYSINYGKIDNVSEAIVGYNIAIKNDSVTFSGGGYQTNFQYLCNLEFNKDTLVFKYSKTIEGDNYNEDTNFPILKMYAKDEKWYAKSKLIYLKGKNINNMYVEIIKRK